MCPRACNDHGRVFEYCLAKEIETRIKENNIKFNIDIETIENNKSDEELMPSIPEGTLNDMKKAAVLAVDWLIKNKKLLENADMINLHRNKDSEGKRSNPIDIHLEKLFKE